MHKRHPTPADVVPSPSPLAPPVHVEFRPLLVALDVLIQSPLNPRKRNHDSSLSELAESIRRNGVIEPVVIRESGAEPGKYELVAGSRRLRAAKLAGLTEIPAMVRNVSDQELVELALQENIQRRDMHPLDEAEALYTLQQLDGAYRDLEVLAAKVGRSATYVRDRLRLRALDPLVVEALDADAITLKHAELIATAAPDQHRRALEACFSKILTVGKDHWVPVAKAIEQKQWKELGLALMGTRDLDEWVRTWSKRDVKSDAVQDVLRPVLEREARQPSPDDDPDAGGPSNELLEEEIEERTAKVLQLSEKGGWEFNAAKARQAGVLSRDQYKIVNTEKMRCKYTKRGVIVHPAGAAARVLDVCASKSCSKHHPKPTHSDVSSSRQSAADREREERAEAARVAREKAEEDAWKTFAPHAFAALVKHVLALKPTATLLTALFWPAGSYGTVQVRSQDHVRSHFGLAMTDKTAFAVLLLARVNTETRAFFEGSTKRFNFNLAAVEKAHAKAEAKKDAVAAKAKGKTRATGSAAKKANATKRGKAA